MPGDCSAKDADVPASPAELNAWLQKRIYRCWAHETKIHPSDGPHGGNVQTFVNGAMHASLVANANEHPRGSVAVKELYSGGTSVTGWAVMVKTEPTSSGGKGWYWYEVFDTAPSPTGGIEGQGKGLCVNCHAPGRDFFLTPFPLR